MALGSVVDYLRSQGQDSSFSARKNMADKYGIQNYKGTAEQNTSLLSKLQGGSGSSASSGASAPNAPAAVSSGTTGQIGGYANIYPGSLQGVDGRIGGYANIYPGSLSGGQGVGGAAGAGGASGSASGSESGSTVSRNYQRSDRVNDLYNRAMSAADSIPDEYDPSERVLGYRDKLDDLEADQPGPYKSRYDAQINGLLEQILNEDPFTYTGKDMMNDDLYKMYSDIYSHGARLAMQDAMGNAAAMTGGYGSTYSQAAGQQAFDERMSGLNNIAMELADRAYQRYSDNRANRYNQMGVLNTLEDRDYGMHRDKVGDWKDLLNYYAGRYDSEYARDYGQYRDEVADAQNQRDYLSSMYDTEHDNDFAEYGSDLAESQWNRQFELEQAQNARAQEEWELDKQLKQLQLQQAQMALAGIGSGGSGGSGGGGGRRRSGGSSSGEAVTGGDLNPTVDVILSMLQNGDDYDTVSDAIKLSKDYYKDTLTGDSLKRANASLKQLEQRNNKRRWS